MFKIDDEVFAIDYGIGKVINDCLIDYECKGISHEKYVEVEFEKNGFPIIFHSDGRKYISDDKPSLYHCTDTFKESTRKVVASDNIRIILPIGKRTKLKFKKLFKKIKNIFRRK